MAKPPKTGSTVSTRRTVGKTLEMATRRNSIDFAYFGGFLPNPDPVLKKLGKDITIYEELKADAHLGSVISSRKSGVKSLLWEIDRGKAKSRQAKAITDHLNTLSIPSIISEIMDAPFYGYQPLEVVWQPFGNGLVMPEKVIGKPPEWFQFNEDNDLRWRSLKNPLLGEELPPRKFLLPRHNATYKNPYGEPLLSRCYWPVTFKRSNMKFWITFSERYGMPWPVGKLPRSSPQADFDKMLENLESMVQDAMAVIPNDGDIEFLESGSKSASADIYEGLVAWANAEMSKAIVGHSGAADSTPGKLGGEDNALEVRGDLIAEDKILVEEVFNQLIRWICEVNFGEGVEPPTFVLYEEEEVDQEQATRDKTLFDQGVRLSPEYFERTYGFQPGDILEVKKDEPAPLPGKPPADFAEGKRPLFDDQAAMDRGVDAATRAEDLRRETAAVARIIEVFNQSKDYSEAMEAAIAEFPRLNTDALQEKVGRAIFLSGVIGRLSEQE